jgi:hypothetical protein
MVTNAGIIVIMGTCHIIMVTVTYVIVNHSMTKNTSKMKR